MIALSIDIGLNVIPFRDILSNTLQYAQNIILFISLGLFLPVLWKRFEKIQLVLISGFLLSLAIEMIQLLSFRSMDIDDLLMNTLGTFMGYCFFVLMKKMFSWILKCRCDDNVVFENREVYFIIVFSWTAMFFLQPFIANLFWNSIL